MMSFGPLRWPDTPNALSSVRVPVPVNATCLHCEEVITIRDGGYITPLVTPTGVQDAPEHEECFIRRAVGSYAHLTKQCSCYIEGATDTDPSDLSKRQAARLAMLVFGERLAKEDPHLDPGQ